MAFGLTIESYKWKWAVSVSKPMGEGDITRLAGALGDWKMNVPLLTKVEIKQTVATPPKRWKYLWELSDGRIWEQEIIQDNPTDFRMNFNVQSFFAIGDFAPAREIRNQLLQLIQQFELIDLEVTW